MEGRGVGGGARPGGRAWVAGVPGTAHAGRPHPRARELGPATSPGAALLPPCRTPGPAAARRFRLNGRRDPPGAGVARVPPGPARRDECGPGAIAAWAAAAGGPLRSSLFEPRTGLPADAAAAH